MCAVAVTVAPTGCRNRDTVTAATASSTADSPTSKVRDDALARAHVWTPPRVDPAAADFSVNPPAADAFDANADVECRFVAGHGSGSTPKFTCETPDGKHLKVKFGAPNGEPPAEVAGTRLLAALGFPVDR